MKTQMSVLPNGLRVVTTENHSQMVCVNVSVNVGSKNETPQNSGISHFLEHSLFLGTKRRSKDRLAIDLANIASETNAFTGDDHTNYYICALSCDFSKAVELLSDIIQNPVFPEKNFRNEKKVIIEEYQLRKNDEDTNITELMYDMLLGVKKHQINALGTIKNIRAFRVEDLQAHWAKYYTSPNMVVSIAGNIKHAQALKIVSRYFKHLSETPVELIAKPKYIGGAVFILAGKPGFDLVFDATDNKNSIVKYVLASILSQKLTNAVREQKGLTYDISAQVLSIFGHSFLNIVTSFQSKNFDNVLELTTEKILECTNGYVSEEELVIAKKKIISCQIQILENNKNSAFYYGKQLLKTGEIIDIPDIIKATDDVSIKEVNKFARIVFSKKPTYVVSGEKVDPLPYEYVCGIFVARMRKPEEED